MPRSRDQSWKRQSPGKKGRGSSSRDQTRGLTKESGQRSAKRSFLKRNHSRYERHDIFYRRAKNEGYVARSVYKLEELDQSFKLMNEESHVIDFGCAPGSWMQYTSKVVNPEKGGFAVGIDLLDVVPAFPPHVKIVKGDIYEVPPEDLLPPGVTLDDCPFFDLVLSDMAPNTTGISSVDQDRSLGLCERVLELSKLFLRDSGHLAMKILEGGGQHQLVKMMKNDFKDVRVKRPKSTRPGSKETFLVGLHYRR